MILQPGEKVHLIHRRRYDKDQRRHFAGEVENYEHGLARIKGYAFVTDDFNKHEFIRRDDMRTKIAPLSSGELIVNIIPDNVDIELIRYELQNRQLMVTDGSWKMDVKEFGSG